MGIEDLERSPERERLSCSRPANLMEVCGTHSQAIARYGIKQLLPEGVRMLSGPGCPVCVTPVDTIDLAIEIARQPNAVVTTFGDMMRVPGSETSLSEEKARGRDIRVMYSPMAAVSLARETPGRQVCFVGVGFETTAPMVAAAVLEAERCQLPNFSVIAAHKLVPPALRALLDSGDVQIDGLLCPGHVAAILGTKPFDEIAREYSVPCVIGGFEADDVLAALKMLLRQIETGQACGENAYGRCVRDKGNPRARATMSQVFEPTDAIWRGLGMIPGSGLEIKWAYSQFEAQRKFGVTVPPGREAPGCRCGDILTGRMRPAECPLFGQTCVPESPVGPCMVSSEGACSAVYRYER